MKDRQPTQVLSNGAIRYGVYNADGTLEVWAPTQAQDRLLGAILAASGLAACGAAKPTVPPLPPGELQGVSMDLGHRLRGGAPRRSASAWPARSCARRESRPAPDRWRRRPAGA